MNIDLIRSEAKQAILASLRSDVARLRQNGKLSGARLIGSFATNSWDAFSDIDLICISTHALSFRDFSRTEKRELDLIIIDQDTLSKRMEDPLFRDTYDKGIDL